MTADADDPGPPDSDVDALLARHLSGLHAFVRLRAGPAVRAQESLSDLVQSVCRDALAERGTFRYAGEAQFRAWLYTAALRKIVDRDRFYHRDKRDVRRLVSPGRTDDDRPDVLLQAYATMATPSRVLAAKEQVQALEAAFDELTEEQREVVSLARIAGLSYADVAAQTGRSEEACRQIVHRATVRLSMALQRAGY